MVNALGAAGQEKKTVSHDCERKDLAYDEMEHGLWVNVDRDNTIVRNQIQDDNDSDHCDCCAVVVHSLQRRHRRTVHSCDWHFGTVHSLDWRRNTVHSLQRRHRNTGHSLQQRHRNPGHSLQQRHRDPQQYNLNQKSIPGQSFGYRYPGQSGIVTRINIVGIIKVLARGLRVVAWWLRGIIGASAKAYSRMSAATDASTSASSIISESVSTAARDTSIVVLVAAIEGTSVGSAVVVVTTL